VKVPKIQVDLDRLTIGHVEDLDSRKLSKVIPVFYDLVRLDGVPDDPDAQREAIRALPFTAIEQITDAIRDAVDRDVNAEDDTGKN
jgi:hypothetical protein